MPRSSSAVSVRPGKIARGVTRRKRRSSAQKLKSRKNSQQKRKSSEYMKKWRKANKERLKRYNKNYRALNKR